MHSSKTTLLILLPVLCQFKEFLGTYNKVTENCFMDCVKDFTTRDVKPDEVQKNLHWNAGIHQGCAHKSNLKVVFRRDLKKQNKSAAFKHKHVKWLSGHEPVLISCLSSSVQLLWVVPPEVPEDDPADLHEVPGVPHPAERGPRC